MPSFEFRALYSRYYPFSSDDEGGTNGSTASNNDNENENDNDGGRPGFQDRATTQLVRNHNNNNNNNNNNNHGYTDRSEQQANNNNFPQGVEHSEGGNAAEYWHRVHQQKEQEGRPAPCGEENCDDNWEYMKPTRDYHQEVTSTSTTTTAYPPSGLSLSSSGSGSADFVDDNGGSSSSSSLGNLAPIFAFGFIALVAALIALAIYARYKCLARRRRADYAEASMRFRERELEERKEKIRTQLRCTQFMGPTKDGCTNCASCTLIDADAGNNNKKMMDLEEGGGKEGGEGGKEKPTTEYANNDDSNNNNNNDDDALDENVCCICLEPFSDQEWISVSNNPQCKHRFHKECIENWLLRQDGCPTCRMPYLSSTDTTCLKVKEEEEEEEEDFTMTERTVIMIGSEESTNSSDDLQEEEEEQDPAEPGAIASSSGGGEPEMTASA